MTNENGGATQKKSDELARLRAQIDEIDQTVLHLIEKRQQLSAEVANAKPKGSPVFRPGREQSLLTKLTEMADTKTVPLISSLWRTLMSASIVTQKPDFKVGHITATAGAAQQFSAGMMTVLAFGDAATGRDALLSGNTDILLIDDAGLVSILNHLGVESAVYITAVMPMVRAAGTSVICWFIVPSLPDRTNQDNAIFADPKTGRIALVQVSEYQDIPIFDDPAFRFVGCAAGNPFSTEIPVVCSR